MKKDSDNPLFEEIFRESGFDRDPSFRSRFKFDTNGFTFEQQLLKGGCLAWLFLSVIVPFCLWVYPGGFNAPLGVTLVLAGFAVAGWFMLLADLTRKVVLIAESGSLQLEWGCLGVRRKRALALEKGSLIVYKQMQSAGGMINVYGIRDAVSGQNLKVAGSKRECLPLVAMIERTVIGNPSAGRSD
jgi:hypothetical protein